MALARVVEFDGVDAARMEELNREIEQGDRPDDVPATEILLLHDPDANKSLVLLFFEDDAAYAKGDAALNAMPSDETPGRRTSVTKYRVVNRMTA
jgi:hypothetical protein